MHRNAFMLQSLLGREPVRATGHFDTKANPMDRHCGYEVFSKVSP